MGLGLETNAVRRRSKSSLCRVPILVDAVRAWCVPEELRFLHSRMTGESDVAHLAFLVKAVDYLLREYPRRWL